MSNFYRSDINQRPAEMLWQVSNVYDSCAVFIKYNSGNKAPYSGAGILRLRICFPSMN